MTVIQHITDIINNPQALYLAMIGGILYMSYNIVRRLKRVISNIIGIIWISTSALGASAKDIVLSAINIGGEKLNITPSALSMIAVVVCAVFALHDITRRRIRFF